MTHLLRDARFGLRLLWKNPGFTSVAVLALALGIAANTAIFSVVYATLLAPLPYPEPDQLVMVWSKIRGNRNVTAAGDYLDWKHEGTVFQDLNAWTGRGVSVATSASDRPEQFQAGVTTPGFFTMVGDPLFLGRDSQSPWPGTTMAVRTAVDPDSTRKSLAAVVQSMDADLPMADVKTMDQLVDEALAGDRFNALLFGSFAGLALVLAALGIYGVMSFAVAQRTHEIDLRMALGAGRGQVLRQVLREGMGTALVGAAVGCLGAYFVGRAMQGCSPA
jgi:hypothetical protein